MLNPVPFGDVTPAGFRPLDLVFRFEKLKYMRPDTEVESHHLPFWKVASSVLTAAAQDPDALRVRVAIGSGPYFVGEGFELGVAVVAAGQRPEVELPRMVGPFRLVRLLLSPPPKLYAPVRVQQMLNSYFGLSPALATATQADANPGRESGGITEW